MTNPVYLFSPRQLLIADIVLLPLLGGTWLFGLLSVNQETAFFAWLFTILSSLQVSYTNSELD